MPNMKEKVASVSEAAASETESSPLPFEALDKRSFTPMYAQIQAQLLGMIHSGRLNAGDLLPSEEELSRVYGVSRMTARQALQLLKSQGLATRHRGRGTFVAQPKMEKDITHLSGFTAEMQALGLKSSSKVLKAETIEATDKIAEQLGIKAGTPVFRLSRLRLADGLPLAFEEVFLSLARFPGILDVDFAHQSLYQTLHESYGVRFGMADETLEARAAGRLEAQLLDIPPRSSLLVISRTLRGTDGEPIETCCSCYRGDRYRAVLRIPATIMG